MTGFDSVDDESKPENPMFDIDVPTPDQVTYVSSEMQKNKLFVIL